MAKKKSRKENTEPEVTKAAAKSAETEGKVTENEVNNKNDVQKEGKEIDMKNEGSADQIEDTAPLTDMELLTAELEASKKRAQEATDQYVRLLAEFDNFRKRTRREQLSLREYASEKLLTALLPVVDDFARSMTVMEKTDNLSSVKEGIQMVNDKLQRVLEKEGLNAIECTGKPFDSEIHEAIHSVEVPEEEKKGIVLEEVEKGYRLKDKVIRYSKVIVGE